MEFVRLTSIHDPLFAPMHQLLSQVFPPDEVYAYDAWEVPLKIETIRVCVAVHEGEVVGAAEYRYVPELQVAMSEFTIVARTGLGVGRFIWQQREADLRRMAAAHAGALLGTFAEVYNPELVTELTFGQMPAMHPVVRREVLSHIGFKRLEIPYVHPSWRDDGTPVTNLDLCFQPTDDATDYLPGHMVADFLTAYYTVLPNKPAAWHEMIADLRSRETVALRPL